ncbi:4-hydroxy-2-ketovalerate aldolase [Campylobacter avium]|uniref:4-hydroxy-2-ketovalerate aldolase n=1 Tax=Campylobacter avium TaxID=522485 RepID=UPI002352298C|nr:4-hydroxy-2-ketovalerate aldolase [Campylobacter avium]
MKILDCTLRDGAHINAGKFGEKNIKAIIKGLINAKIDIIELGFLQDGLFDKDYTFFESIDKADELLKNFEQKNSSFSIMLRTDRCNIKNIKESKYIKIARIALYKEHLKHIADYVKKLKDLGYTLILNPIAITKYSDDEIKSLIDELLNFYVDGISIVDTFGAFTMKGFLNVIRIFDERLAKELLFGVHLHENLSQSLSLALKAIELLKDRKLIIDASISGMGRMPGNLAIELLVGSLASEKYDLKELIKLCELCKEYKNINEWGYNPIYAYQAFLNIDRTYSEYFARQGLSSLDNIILQEEVKKKGYGDKFKEEKASELISFIKEKR